MTEVSEEMLAKMRGDLINIAAAMAHQWGDHAARAYERRAA